VSGVGTAARPREHRVMTNTKRPKCWLFRHFGRSVSRAGLWGAAR
jgi:hypothetical protein